MKQLFSLIVCFIAILISSCNQSNEFNLSTIDPGQYDSTWWNRTPLRFIQTNLREIDADNMDVDSYVQSIVDLGANFVLFNVGGIVANYPTQLPFHYKNPYMKGDLVGEVVKKLHENGIKVKARFDFSKVNETIAFKNPDWLYVGTDGKFVNYNGQVHTCVNGGYQQKYGFEILKEAVSAYPFDAIFFNMGGYQTSDYSQISHGICQCNNCKRRFFDSTGMVLPVRSDPNDPVFRKYREFQSATSAELNSKINKLLKELDPNLVLCVYSPDGEIRRSESGTGFTSGEYWSYHATENVKRTLNSFKNKSPFDSYNYLLGMDYRHTATSPNIGRILLAEQMLNGAALGIYFIGHLDSQYDRAFMPELNDIYKFHQANEKLFTNLQPQSKVGLIIGSGQENRGIMKMLIEEHIMFDLIHASALGTEDAPRKPEEYDVLILGDINDMNDDFISMIDNYVKNGGKILATGFPGINDGTGSPLNMLRLKSLGVLPDYEVLTSPRSSYLVVSESDKVALGQNLFKDFDLIMMNSRFLKVKATDNAETYLKLVPNTMHGPPEKCYFTDAEITGIPGLVSNAIGEGKAVFIPWHIGAQYHWKGNNAQRALFLSALQNLLKIDNSIVTDASPLIEMTHMVNRSGAFEWIGMINHSGQINGSYREPVAIHQTTIRFRSQKPVRKIRLMRSGKDLEFKQSEGWAEVIVPLIDDFEMLVCLYK